MTSSKSQNLGVEEEEAFQTGPKWESTRVAIGEPKYVIVNCDEGDPGAFMDRALMEGNPHKILEGLMIGAYAMGATKGYIYVRDEYPIALQNIKVAIAPGSGTRTNWQ